MRIMARSRGVLDGIMKCTQCSGAMVKVGMEYRCIDKIPPEELVAVGLIPNKDASGKLNFDLFSADQQKIQCTQALSSSEEIDNAFLQSLGLDLQKIKEYQLKHNLVP